MKAHKKILLVMFLFSLSLLFLASYVSSSDIGITGATTSTITGDVPLEINFPDLVDSGFDFLDRLAERFGQFFNTLLGINNIENVLFFFVFFILYFVILSTQIFANMFQNRSGAKTTLALILGIVSILGLKNAISDLDLTMAYFLFLGAEAVIYYYGYHALYLLLRENKVNYFLGEATYQDTGKKGLGAGIIALFTLMFIRLMDSVVLIKLLPGLSLGGSLQSSAMALVFLLLDFGLIIVAIVGIIYGLVGMTSSVRRGHERGIPGNIEATREAREAEVKDELHRLEQHRLEDEAHQVDALRKKISTSGFNVRLKDDIFALIDRSTEIAQLLYDANRDLLNDAMRIDPYGNTIQVHNSVVDQATRTANLLEERRVALEGIDFTNLQVDDIAKINAAINQINSSEVNNVLKYLNDFTLGLLSLQTFIRTEPANAPRYNYNTFLPFFRVISRNGTIMPANQMFKNYFLHLNDYVHAGNASANHTAGRIDDLSKLIRNLINRLTELSKNILNIHEVDLKNSSGFFRRWFRR